MTEVVTLSEGSDGHHKKASGRDAMHKAVDLPPLVIILSVLVGLHKFGLPGDVLAAPGVASTREVLIYIHVRVTR